MSPRTVLPSVKRRAAALLVSAATALFTATPARAVEPVGNPEPFLKKDDVIAFIGGEDLVAAAEYGYLELLLQRALPGHHLKFRSLAWEGDTVFEQRRDLNYPTLEQQLDQIGATVVICQFGQMESLASGRVGVPPGAPSVGRRPGPASPAPTPSDGARGTPAPAGGTPTLPDPSLPEFIAAYEKLIARVGAGGKRRVLPLSQPSGLLDISPGQGPGLWDVNGARPERAQEASPALARADTHPDVKPRVSPGANIPQPSGLAEIRRTDDGTLAPDGVHLSIKGQVQLARRIVGSIDMEAEGLAFIPTDGFVVTPGLEPLRQLIVAKNRLWYHYYRPSNWAFLAGDRTNQPSSRDHLDPTKRWFPAEMEQWLPLIDAKEKEIWATAQKLAQP